MLASKPLSDDDVKVVAGASIFAGLHPEAVREVASHARKVTVKKGQALFHQAHPAGAVFLVLSGRVKVIEHSEDGHAVVLRLEQTGALLGLLAALGGEPSYPVTAEAIEAATAARWDGKALAALLKKHPGIAAAALPIVLARLRRSQDQVRELVTEKVERRVARLIVRLVRQAGQKTPEGVKVDIALTRQELAEMSGTTLYTVSRLLSQWAHDGVLLSKGKKLLITAPHALVKLAEDAGP